MLMLYRGSSMINKEAKKLSGKQKHSTHNLKWTVIKVDKKLEM